MILFALAAPEGHLLYNTKDVYLRIQIVDPNQSVCKNRNCIVKKTKFLFHSDFRSEIENKNDANLIANKLTKLPITFAAHLFSDATSCNAAWLCNNNVTWSAIFFGFIQNHLRNLNKFSEICVDFAPLKQTIQFIMFQLTCVLFPHPVDPSITTDGNSAIFDKIFDFNA